MPPIQTPTPAKLANTGDDKGADLAENPETSEERGYDGEHDADDTYRVNVPAEDASALAEGPDTGYALVRYSRDDGGYCVDLATLRLPGEQPEHEEPDGDEGDLSLEELAQKIMKEPAGGSRKPSQVNGEE